MAALANHQTVESGLYISFRKPDLVYVPTDNSPIEGVDGGNYHRLNTFLTILIAPILGGLFVIGFPLVVIVAVVYGLLIHLHRLIRPF